jgi:hypothetical protein
MTNEDFDKLLEESIDLIRNTLSSKGKEYGRGDRLHNFKVAGRRLNCTPERALIGMKEKHCVSVMDIVDDLDNGVLPTMQILKEKILDETNYLILLNALIRERLSQQKA